MDAPLMIDAKVDDSDRLIEILCFPVRQSPSGRLLLSDRVLAIIHTSS